MPDTFRRLALELPEMVEGTHMSKLDFRVGGRIFATLGRPNEEWGMVALRPQEQEVLMGAEPVVYRPIPGGWGKRGCTFVNLAEVDEVSLRSALLMAWRGKAAKRLVVRHAALVDA